MLFQSITHMAPAAAVAFSIIAGAPFAAGALPLGVLLALVACLFVASSIGQLAKHLPSAGGFATYTSRGLHPAVGFMVAWLYSLAEANVSSASNRLPIRASKDLCRTRDKCSEDIGSQRYERSIRVRHGPSSRPPVGRTPTWLVLMVSDLPELLALLRCPVCRSPLRSAGERLRCANPGCSTEFLILHGVPVLINPRSSVFSASESATHGPEPFDTSRRSRWGRRLRRILPDLGTNLCTARNVERLASLVTKDGRRGRVLVIGGGVLGAGMERLIADERLRVVETDIYVGPRTAVVLDAHEIPFPDGSFDAVVAQAVLEHVLDPHRCVEEIERVLGPDGLVYAETPFMQQVHGSAYDFTRFTPLGHRRLFRRFVEIDSGLAVGPGTALAWSWTYFLASFCGSPRARSGAHLLGRLTGFFWKWFDPYLAARRGALDAASGVYFLGTKGPPGWYLPDSELIASYRGIH